MTYEAFRNNDANCLRINFILVFIFWGVVKNLIEKYKKLRDKYLLMSKNYEDHEDCLFWGNAYRIYKEIVRDLEELG